MSDLPATGAPLERAMKRVGFVPAEQAPADHPFKVTLDALARAQAARPPTHTFLIMVGNWQEGYRFRIICDRVGADTWVTCSSRGEIDPAWRCPSCGLIPGREQEGVAVDTNDVTAWPALEDA